ncbi:hypothetical protein ES705_50924 [subsurface metagenome]
MNSFRWFNFGVPYPGQFIITHIGTVKYLIEKPIHAVAELCPMVFSYNFVYNIDKILSAGMFEFQSFEIGFQYLVHSLSSDKPVEG